MFENESVHYWVKNQDSTWSCKTDKILNYSGLISNVSSRSYDINGRISFYIWQIVKDNWTTGREKNKMIIQIFLLSFAKYDLYKKKKEYRTLFFSCTVSFFVHFKRFYASNSWIMNNDQSKPILVDILIIYYRVNLIKIKLDLYRWKY